MSNEIKFCKDSPPKAAKPNRAKCGKWKRAILGLVDGEAAYIKASPKENTGESRCNVSSKLHQAAKAHGVKVRTYTDTDGDVICVLKGEDDSQ